jgi:hypothetical protein
MAVVVNDAGDLIGFLKKGFTFALLLLKTEARVS